MGQMVTRYRNDILSYLENNSKTHTQGKTNSHPVESVCADQISSVGCPAFTNIQSGFPLTHTNTRLSFHASAVFCLVFKNTYKVNDQININKNGSDQHKTIQRH